MKKIFKKTLIAAFFIMLLFCVTACDENNDKNKKDIEFTVCDKTRMPQELLDIIEERKEKVFKLSYINSGYMYIAVGYGEHNRKNYNVVVEELYSTDNAIYVETNLYTETETGTDANKGEASMYPYIVIKCEKSDLPVVFDID